MLALMGVVDSSWMVLGDGSGSWLGVIKITLGDDERDMDETVGDVWDPWSHSMNMLIVCVKEFVGCMCIRR